VPDDPPFRLITHEDPAPTILRESGNPLTPRPAEPSQSIASAMLTPSHSTTRLDVSHEAIGRVPSTEIQPADDYGLQPPFRRRPRGGKRLSPARLAGRSPMSLRGSPMPLGHGDDHGTPALETTLSIPGQLDAVTSWLNELPSPFSQPLAGGALHPCDEGHGNDNAGDFDDLDIRELTVLLPDAAAAAPPS